jgi:glutathione S-transferase
MSLILHEFAASGNCYKIRLLLAHLGQPYARREYDILKGETRTPAFLANINSNGRIPVLQDGDAFLPESNAILWYLAEGTGFLPADKMGRAQVLQWLFFEQYNHEPNIATLRYWLTYGGGMEKLSDWQKASVPVKQAGGEAALAVMEDHLRHHDWFVGSHYSIADIALYAYTHVAEDGGAFSLSNYPAINRWLARVAEQKGHVLISDKNNAFD